MGPIHLKLTTNTWFSRSCLSSKTRENERITMQLNYHKISLERQDGSRDVTRKPRLQRGDLLEGRWIVPPIGDPLVGVSINSFFSKVSLQFYRTVTLSTTRSSTELISKSTFFRSDDRFLLKYQQNKNRNNPTNSSAPAAKNALWYEFVFSATKPGVNEKQRMIKLV